MRKILFAAALSVSSIAFAQATTQPPTTTEPTTTTTTNTTDDAADDTAQPSGQTVNDPSQATGPQGVTQQGTVPQGQATAPAGTNMGVQGQTGTGMAAQPMAGQQAAFTPRPATTEYPPCSRTVTDNCIQTYERGVRRGRRR